MIRQTSLVVSADRQTSLVSADRQTSLAAEEYSPTSMTRADTITLPQAPVDVRPNPPPVESPLPSVGIIEITPTHNDAFMAALKSVFTNDTSRIACMKVEVAEEICTLSEWFLIPYGWVPPCPYKIVAISLYDGVDIDQYAAGAKRWMEENPSIPPVEHEVIGYGRQVIYGPPLYHEMTTRHLFPKRKHVEEEDATTATAMLDHTIQKRRALEAQLAEIKQRLEGVKCEESALRYITRPRATHAWEQ